MTFSFTTLVRWVGLLAGIIAGAVATAEAQAPAWQAVGLVTPTSAGGTASIAATVADASGNVYVAGTFNGTIALGGTTFVSTGSRDVFVAKWVPATQSFAWVQRSSGTGHETLSGLATSGGNVYVAGYFESTAAFGSSTFTSAGSNDAFVAKLTDAGSSASFAWAYRAGGADNDQASALAVNGTALYMAGSFVGTATFGSASYTGAGSTDTFLTKLTDAGPGATFAWTQALGSVTNDYASGVAVQGTSVYLMGYFTGSMAFGATSLGSAGTAGMFIAKLTDAGSSGSFGWAQRAGSTSFILPSAVVVQGGQVYLGGRFQGGTATFGTTTLSNTTAGNSNYTGFVTKLTDAGSASSFGWAYAVASSNGSNYINALAVRGSSVFLAGGVGGTVSLGSTTITVPGFVSDVLVARLVDAGPSASFAWAQSAGGTSIDEALALTTTGTAIYVGGYIYSVASFGSQPVGSASAGQTGFFTSLADATGLATLGATAAIAKATIFPTPTPRGTVATVQLPATTKAGSVELAVLDGVGRVVCARTAPVAAGSQQATLDIAGLAPGMYALHVAVGESLGTARLVVE
ncbi:MAG: hypothetical protein ACRYFZ_25895 [Janthinobacterium lividum]